MGEGSVVFVSRINWRFVLRAWCWGRKMRQEAEWARQYSIRNRLASDYGHVYVARRGQSWDRLRKCQTCGKPWSP
jgi:hypothetical protein